MANLFAPIQPPKIRTILRKDVQSFLSARDACEHSFEAHPGMNPVSYRSCFDADYLEALVMAEAFGEEVDEVSFCTDEVLKAKLEEIAGAYKNVDYDQELAEVKKHIRMESSEDDPKNRILALNVAYLKFFRKRGWDFYKTSQKAAIQHICAVLQPPELKIRVESALKLEKASLKKDYKNFMKYLVEEAALCELYNPLRKHGLNPKPTDGSGTGRRPKSGNPGSSTVTDPPKKTVSDEPPKPSLIAPPCIVSGCKGKHFVRDHLPKIPEAE